MEGLRAPLARLNVAEVGRLPFSTLISLGLDPTCVGFRLLPPTTPHFARRPPPMPHVKCSTTHLSKVLVTPWGQYQGLPLSQVWRVDCA
jgi:hypothetical protein